MKKLKWTNEPPTNPGWYWMATRDGTFIVRVVEKEDEELFVKFDFIAIKASMIDAEWAGPIPKP